MYSDLAPRIAPLFIVAFLSLASGCSQKSDKWTDARPPVYPTKGQVLLNGEPVSQATVTFQPADPAGKAGYAVTDANGYFYAQTFDPGDGLIEGSHLVAIQKTQLIDRDGNVVTEVREPGGIREKNFLPEKYAKFNKSEIKVEVLATNNNDLGPLNLSK